MTVYEWAMAATPTPDPNFDPNAVTPQWIGFLATFLVAVATVMLVVDMTRRIRRVRYREEIRTALEAERAAADLGVAGLGVGDLGVTGSAVGDLGVAGSTVGDQVSQEPVEPRGTDKRGTDKRGTDEGSTS
jgi:hypothetical protein